MDLLALASRHLFHPLWDLRDHSVRLRTLSELERSQWQPESQVRETQWARLGEALRYAAARSPFYRGRFAQAGLDPAEVRSPEDLRRLPLVTKRDVRAHLHEMLSDEFPRSSLGRAKTGGSTGTALDLFFDKRCEEMRNAAAMRSDRWAGWNVGELRGAIWGNPPLADTLKKKIRLALHDRVFYLDTMNITAETMQAFVDTWRRRQPTAIFGHAHSIFILARYLEAQRIQDVRPRAIVSTSMMLLPPERAVIERSFGCPVTDRYGCEEVGLIASECERHDGLHVNAEHVYVELLDDDGRPVREGETGRVVVTDLINRGMPLIRYVVEDMAVARADRCPCGRGLPLMGRVTGRLADFLRRADGSLVAGVSLVERTLTAIPGLEQMQIVQEAIDDLLVNVVRGPEHAPTSDTALRAELHEVFGSQARIRIQHVNGLSQERSGKYRFAICRMGG